MATKSGGTNSIHFELHWKFSGNSEAHNRLSDYHNRLFNASASAKICAKIRIIDYPEQHNRLSQASVKHRFWEKYRKSISKQDIIDYPVVQHMPLFDKNSDNPLFKRLCSSHRRLFGRVKWHSIRALGYGRC